MLACYIGRMAHTQTPRPSFRLILERILAVLAAAACLFLSVGLWRTVSTNQPMWPLPGLYFVELPAIGILSAVLFLGEYRFSATVGWIVSGVYVAFVLLGAFSVGLFYLPIAIMFIMVAVLATVRQEHSILRGLGALLLGAMAQAILIGLGLRLVQGM